MSTISRSRTGMAGMCCENFLYHFQGRLRRRGPPACAPAPRKRAGTGKRISGGARQGADAARPRAIRGHRAGGLRLAPSAHAGRRPSAVLGTARHRLAAATPAGRTHAGTAILPAPHCRSRPRSPSRALRPSASASHAMALRTTLDCDLDRLQIGASRLDGQERRTPVALLGPRVPA